MTLLDKVAPNLASWQGALRLLTQVALWRSSFLGLWPHVPS